MSWNRAKRCGPLVLLLATGCGGGAATVAHRFPTLRSTFECPRDKNIDDQTAARISAAALPQAWAVLEEVEQQECWDAAVRVAGYAGGVEAFARLQAYVESRAPLFAMSEDLFHIQTAFAALGNVVWTHEQVTTATAALRAKLGRAPTVTEIAVRTGLHPERVERAKAGGRAANEALAYLVESTEPLNWVKRSIDWPVDAVVRREIIAVISRAATSALGTVGRSEATSQLLTMALDSAARRAYEFRFQSQHDGTESVESLINLHVLPPGRVTFSIGRLLSKLPADFDAGVRARLEQAHRAGLECWRHEQDWVANRRTKDSLERAVRAADAVADARLSGFHGQIDSLRHLLDGPAAMKAIDEVAQITFPEGPLELIHADYAEQVDRALAAMDTLRREKPEEVARLRLGPYIKTVVEAHERLRRALASGLVGIGFDEVIEARARLQRRVRVAVAAVVARFPSWGDEDVANRKRAMGLILEQNEIVDSLLRRRLPVHDINAETGQEIVPFAGAAAGPAEEPSEAPR